MCLLSESILGKKFNLWKRRKGVLAAVTGFFLRPSTLEKQYFVDNWTFGLSFAHDGELARK